MPVGSVPMNEFSTVPSLEPFEPEAVEPVAGDGDVVDDVVRAAVELDADIVREDDVLLVAELGLDLESDRVVGESAMFEALWSRMPVPCR